MTYVVSRNYFEPESRFKWMVRYEKDSVNEQTAFTSGIILKVKFEESNVSEQGFGCRKVAKATVLRDWNVTEYKDKLVHAGAVVEQLHFDGLFFYIGPKVQGDAPSTQIVNEVDILLLYPDGKMECVVHVEDLYNELREKFEILAANSF